MFYQITWLKRATFDPSSLQFNRAQFTDCFTLVITFAKMSPNGWHCSPSAYLLNYWEILCSHKVVSGVVYRHSFMSKCTWALYWIRYLIMVLVPVHCYPFPYLPLRWLWKTPLQPVFGLPFLDYTFCRNTVVWHYGLCGRAPSVDINRLFKVTKIKQFLVSDYTLHY